MAHFPSLPNPSQRNIATQFLEKTTFVLPATTPCIHETSSTYTTIFFRLHRKTSGTGKKRAVSRCLQSSEPDKSQGNDPEGCPESTRWSRWRLGWGRGGCIVVPIQLPVGNGGACKGNLKQNEPSFRFRVYSHIVICPDSLLEILVN